MPALKINLQRREVQVIALLACGLGYKQVGQELGIAENTVGQLLQHLKQRLGIPYMDRHLATGIGLVLGIASVSDVTQRARLSPIWKEDAQ